MRDPFQPQNGFGIRFGQKMDLSPVMTNKTDLWPVLSKKKGLKKTDAEPVLTK